MDSCMICLLVTNDSSSCIFIDSIEWKKCKIKRIIEKHLWWWHLKQSSSRKCSYICRQCWDVLSSFHAFYLEIKKTHQLYDFEKWPILKSSIAKEKCDINERQEPQDNSQVMGKDFKICISNNSETFELLPHSKNINKINNYADDNDQPKNKSKTEAKRQYDEYLARIDHQLFCNLCNIALMNFTELKSHYRVLHGMTGYAMCCNRKFYSRGQYIDHLKIHENPNYFKCTICSKVLSHRFSYENHLKGHKRSTKRNFLCKKCKKSFYKKVDYKRHITSHKQEGERKSIDIYQNNANVISNNTETIELPSVAYSGSTTRSENDDEQFYNTLCSDGVSTNYEPFLNSTQNYFVVSQNTEIEECHSIIKSENVTYSDNVEEIFSDNNVYAHHFEPYANINQNNCINISENTQSVICSENGETFNYTFIEESINDEEIFDCKSSINVTQQHETSNKIKQKYKNVQIKKQNKKYADKQRKKMDEEYLKHSKYEVSCQLCMTSFSSFFELKSHCRLEHNVNGYAVCCNKKMYNRGQFVDHLRVHKNPNYFKCTICGRVLGHRTSYENHLTTHKLQPNEVQDEISDQQFANKIHSKDMQQEKICPFCSKVSKTLRAHRDHIRYSHTEGRKHACPICDKKFRRPYNLREHLSIHTGVPLNACPHCPRLFNNSSNMHTHRKRIHWKEWQEERNKRLAARKLKKLSQK